MLQFGQRFGGFKYRIGSIRNEEFMGRISLVRHRNDCNESWTADVPNVSSEVVRVGFALGVYADDGFRAFR